MTSWKVRLWKEHGFGSQETTNRKQVLPLTSWATLGELVCQTSVFLSVNVINYYLEVGVLRITCKKWKYISTWPKYVLNKCEFPWLLEFLSIVWFWLLCTQWKPVLHVQSFIYFLIMKGIQSKPRIKFLSNCLEFFCK